jgi:hypothetical protein
LGRVAWTMQPTSAVLSTRRSFRRVRDRHCSLCYALEIFQAGEEVELVEYTLADLVDEDCTGAAAVVEAEESGLVVLGEQEGDEIFAIAQNRAETVVAAEECFLIARKASAQSRVEIETWTWRLPASQRPDQPQALIGGRPGQVTWLRHGWEECRVG